MSLTPITREEALLDGQDLEPITRKEQFIKRIYDKTQEVPTPVTREEYFLKKAGEGTSPVAVEQLNVTENGTYSETGKAYSPVIVEVPEPTLITKSITANGTYSASDDNADGYSSVTVAVEGYKKKSIANTPTDIASFNDGTANPMPSLEISIEHVQSGSGDPSPSNVRPISGWSGANVIVCDDVSDPTETHTTSIPFKDSQDNPITVYRGRLNVTSGSCLKYESAINLSSIDSFSSDEVNASGYIRYNCIVSDKAQNYNIMCDKIKVINTTVRGDASSEMISGSSTNNKLYFTIDSTRLTGDLSTAGGRRQALETLLQTDDIQVVYELATPQTYQLTPTQVSTLLGQNNIFADCGQVLEGEYFVTL